MRLRCLLALLLLCLPHASQAEGVIVLLSARGSVTVEGPDNFTADQSYRGELPNVQLKLETGPDSFACLVFSSGLSLFVAADTKLQLKAFHQQPWTTEERDPEYEPSRSSHEFKLSQGALAGYRSTPRPTSLLRIDVPATQIELKAEVFSLNVKGSQLGLIISDHNATIRTGTQKEQYLQAGQVAYRQGDGSIAISELPTKAKEAHLQSTQVAEAGSTEVYFYSEQLNPFAIKAWRTLPMNRLLRTPRNAHSIR